MVIGNGLVAKRFKSYESDADYLIFASGVSDSKSTDPAAYLREFNLLKDCIVNNDDKIIVYFSTTSVNDPSEQSSAYAKHKLELELFVKSSAQKFIIFRVSNLVGHSANPNTILNFLITNIRSNIPFNLWTQACRNLIDVDDFYILADYILRNKLFLNQTVNIANPVSYLVKEIKEKIERFYNLKANCISLDKGSPFEINIEAIVPVIQQTGINFGPDYLERLLKKYYSV